MVKNRVVIIGAGFAGLSAVQYLSQFKHLVEIILIDKYEDIHFRPLIPDVVSGRVKAQSLLYSLLKQREKYGFTFFCETVTSIDFAKKEITLLEHKISYDYLIITTGSQTAFPPNDTFRHFALRLDTVHDANRVRDHIVSGKYENFVICGGGYTGVEIAANIQQLIKHNGMAQQVIIAEMLDQLVSILPSWMRIYIEKSLREMGVQIRLLSKVIDINEKSVVLSNDEKIKNALCIWTTGLEASTLSKSINYPKQERGRIVVDPMLQFSENSFAAGDAACFKSGDNCLRMSVQYAITQGNTAAFNVIAKIQNQSLKQYTPFDPGFIVPLAQGKACGDVLGIKVKGKIAIFLHYLLSAYRSFGIYNRMGILLGLRKAYS